MITQWSVLALLRQLLPLSEEEAADALPLCLTALEQVRARLRDGISMEDGRIARAAAGIAFYTLAVRRVSVDDGVTSFKAGDVSIGRSSAQALAFARSVRDEALADASPVLRDEGFVFRQVKV